MFRLTKTAQIIDRIIKTTPPFIYILLSLIIFIIIFFNYKIFVPKYFLIEDKNLFYISIVNIYTILFLIIVQIMNLKMLKKVNKFNVVPTILTTEKFFIFSVFAVPLFFLFLLLAASDCNNGLACGLSTLSFYLIFFKSLAIMIIYYLAVRTNLKKIRQKSDIPIINPYKGLILASLLLFFLLARLTLDTVIKSYYCGSINCINLDKTRIIEKLRDKNIQQSLYINDPIYAPYTSVSIPGKQNIFSIFKMLKPEDYTRTAIELNDKKICHLLPASTKWVYANGLPADSRWIYINECLQAVNKSKEH